jgi:hypothetical protein
MRKALWLSSALLCISGAQAASYAKDVPTEGKKRNEEMYERLLDQAGWKDQSTASQKPAQSESSPKAARQPKNELSVR